LRALKFVTGRFGKTVGLSTIANGAASALDLLSFFLVARILSAEEMGIFLISLMIGGAVLRIGSPNLAHVTMRAAIRAIGQENPGDLRFILEAGFACDTLLFLFALAAGACAALALVSGDNPVMFAMVLMTVVTSSIKPQVLAIAVPRAFGHHEALYYWVLAGSTLKVALLYACWSLGGGYGPVALAFCAWQMVPATGGLLLTIRSCRKFGVLSSRRSSRKEFQKRHPDLVPLVRDGFLTALPQLVFDLATPIVGFLSGLANAGAFGLAVRVGQAARIYAEPLTFTHYSEQCKAVENGQWTRFTKRTTIWAAGLGGITAVGALVFKLIDETIIALAFGMDYVAAVPAFQWCIIAAIPLTTAMPFQFGLFALGRANRVFQAETIGALTFLGLLAGLPRQAESAAIAMAASRLVSSIVSGYFFWRHANVASRRS
jgi:O-antigen/teichoic acid export membrane protein